MRDSIRDDLVQWVQPPNSRGELQPIADVLPARDTWINNTWCGLDLEPLPGLKVRNSFKWQLYHQMDDEVELALRGVRDRASFIGLINKAEYRLQFRQLSLIPLWKSEFRRQTPMIAREAKRREWSQLFAGIARLPVFLSSYLEGGVEYHLFEQLRDPTPPGAEDSFWELTTIAQLTNVSDYQGYRLTTVIGFDMTRRHFEVEGTRTRTRGFLTVYAGVEQ
mgnify:FL=1